MAENIIELIDGKYQFIKNNLLSSLRKVSENFSVIAVIGENIDLLSNKLNESLQNDRNNNWLIRSISKVFPSENTHRKTPILLLETKLPLQYSDQNVRPNVVHIFGILLKFSSTIVLTFDKIIKNSDLQLFQQIVESNIKNNNSEKFGQLIIMVNDWNPKAQGPKSNSYQTGRKGGEQYLKNEFRDSKIEKYFEEVACILLAPTGLDEATTTWNNLQGVLKDTKSKIKSNVEEYSKDLRKYVESLNKGMVGDLGHHRLREDQNDRKQNKKFKSSNHNLEESLNYYDREVQKLIEKSLLENLSWISFKAIDIEVSAKCKYLFQTKNNSQEDIELLSTELEKKKQDYFKVIQVVIKYRDQWLKELKQNIYIEQGKINEINTEMINKLNIPADHLSKFVQNQLTTIFKTVYHENDFIIEREKEIANKVITKIYENFEVGLNFKIMSGFYNQDQFEIFYEELVKHSVNSLKKNFDYKSNAFLIECENELKLKLENQKTDLFSIYSQNMKNTVTTINFYRDNAIRSIQGQINSKYPDQYYGNKREFENFSEKLMTQTISSFKENMEKNKINLSEEFYNHLIDHNIELIKDRFQQIAQAYSLRQKPAYPAKPKSKPKPQMILPIKSPSGSSSKTKNLGETESPKTLIILFGKTSLDSIYIKNLLNENINIKINDILSRPNNISIRDKLLVGNEAISPDKSFDAKTLLRIRDLKEPNRRNLLKECSFKVDKYNQVKYKTNNLIIESLIALQVLDIKSETEKRVNTNVTNAVFIVPTNYTIKEFEEFRIIGKLSGFEESKIRFITEIDCMVVQFIEKLNTSESKSYENVLIISLNEYECDSAVCQINGYNIKYKSLLNDILNMKGDNLLFSKIFRFFTKGNYILGELQKFINECLKLASINENTIDVILLKTSPSNSELSDYIEKNFTCKIIKVENKDILQGATYYQKSILGYNQDKLYRIKELPKINKLKCKLIVPKHNIDKEYDFSKTKQGEFILREHRLYGHQLPSEIILFHNDCVIRRYDILYATNPIEKGYYEFIINVIINENKQKILVSCSIQDQSGNQQLNVKEILCLDQPEFESQKKIIQSILLMNNSKN